ncbi:MAG: hypothetical protein JWO20_2762 [Candidatus Angelobacter sp.]|jgi:uncharacterized protein (DUF1501 family)|nr:hypothetical protein [Candidatus Angelobacter sp.]
MAVTRRVFLKNSALAVVGTTAIPSFLTRAAFADVNGGGKKRMVVLFQRGAADGLNIVVPHGEPTYYQMRPTIAIPRASVIDLDGLFGLHPSMAAFKPLWDSKQLAIIHASGSPDNSRSHFDAQDYMESGTPGVKSTEDGWLNRALQTEVQHHESANKVSPFKAVALGTALPRTLAGSYPAVAISNINEFGVGGRAAGPAAGGLSNSFESMYAQSVDSVLHGTGQETFEAVKMLKSADPARYTPAAGANYPRGRFGDSLRQVAQLLKADLGVEVAFADIGGWDHHVNEGSTQGQIANLTREFSQAIAAFWTDIGDLGADTVLVTMSEFGRTARENGSRGTDHGHANVMFVLGGPVKGGKVYGRWPGLDSRHLYEGRDLEVTTDFRTVLGEGLSRHMGNRQLATVFPGFSPESKLLNFIR